MTRIVAGMARGRRLNVPGAGTRPTSDRVREALFSSLEAVATLSGARVLDLFAGTGALGLEAVSRGAGEVVLVDSSAQAAAVIAHNVRTVALPGVRVQRQRARDYLSGAPAPFDLVFLDPPYDLARADVEALLAQLTQGWLRDQAIVVAERGRREPQITWPEGFGDAWERRFGDTHVTRAVWYRHRTGEVADSTP